MISKFQKKDKISKIYVKIHCSFDRFIDKIGRYSRSSQHPHRPGCRGAALAVVEGVLPEAAAADAGIGLGLSPHIPAGQRMRRRREPQWLVPHW
jgi:hypothetical protein